MNAMEEYHKNDENKGAKNKNISWNPLFVALMLSICLVQAGCQQIQSNTPSSKPTMTTEAPATLPTPSASPANDPAAAPTPTISPTPTPSVEPTLTPAQKADKIIQTADALKNESNLNCSFLDDSPPRAAIIYAELFCMGYRIEEMNNKKLFDDVFYKMISTINFIATDGTPSEYGESLGVWYSDLTEKFSDIHIPYKLFDKKNDQWVYQYIIDRGRWIKGYDLEHSPNINQKITELCKVMFSIYIEQKPVVLEDGTQISFDTLSPICQYAVNRYLHQMAVLFIAKKKAAKEFQDAGLINVDLDEYHMDEIIQKSESMITPLGNEAYRAAQTYPLCPDEIAEAIHSDAAVKKYLKMAGVKVKTLKK
jgi:hypothetical protein